MAIWGTDGNLRRLRTEKGWTQKDLAGYVDSTQATISMIESDKKDAAQSRRGTHMNIELLKSLAKVFNVTIDELVK